MSERIHIPIGSDMELHEAIGEGGGGSSGGPGTLLELTDVTGDPGQNKSPVGDSTGTFPLTHIVTEDDLNAVLASVALVEWNYLEPLNGFTNLPELFGDNWVPLRYRHNLNNTVHLEGVIKPPPGQSGSPIAFAVIPEESRTGHDQIFAAPGPASTNRGLIYLREDGTLELASAGPWAWVTLCGISWTVEGTSPVLAAAMAQVFSDRGSE